MILSDAASLTVLISSCVLQDLSIRDQSLASILSHVAATVILQPIVNLVHILLFVSVVLSPPRGFDVIQKT
jgi:hypothetical protein